LGITFLRGSVAEAFAWALVQLPRNGRTLRLREMRHAGPLGEVLADEAVGVFIRAAFPGMMRRGEIHLGRGRSLERCIPMKLRAVIACERVDGMRLLPQERNRPTIKFGHGSRAEFAQHEVASLALH